MQTREVLAKLIEVLAKMDEMDDEEYLRAMEELLAEARNPESLVSGFRIRE